jgi:hypothetical protein
LSEVKITIVCRSSPSLLRVDRICPTDQSISAMTSPYRPRFDTPAKLEDTYSGTCGIECGRYRKNERSRLSSMNFSARSVYHLVNLVWSGLYSTIRSPSISGRSG